MSAGLWHGLHRTRRGGSHSSSSAQARSDPTHGARTAGRVASYYGGRFGLTSAPPPQPLVPSRLTALLRRREDALAKRACVGCVYSIQIRPMGTEIRCGGRDLAKRGGVPVLEGGWGSRKWAGLAWRRSFVGKPAWLFEVCSLLGP